MAARSQPPVVHTAVGPQILGSLQGNTIIAVPAEEMPETLEQPIKMAVQINAKLEGRHAATKLVEAEQTLENSRLAIAKKFCQEIDSNAMSIEWAEGFMEGLLAGGYTEGSAKVLKSNYLVLYSAYKLNPKAMEAVFDDTIKGRKFIAAVEIARKINQDERERQQKAKELEKELRSKLDAAKAEGKPLSEDDAASLRQAIIETQAKEAPVHRHKERHSQPMTEAKRDRYLAKLEEMSDEFRGNLPTMDGVRLFCLELLQQAEITAEQALHAAYANLPNSDKERAASTISDVIEHAKATIAELIKVHPGSQKQI